MLDQVLTDTLDAGIWKGLIYFTLFPQYLTLPLFQNNTSWLGTGHYLAGGRATRMRKRVGQEVVALPSESFKTSDPPLTPFNKIVTLPQDKIVERLLTNNVLCFFLHIKL